jgi:hypothetical protein
MSESEEVCVFITAGPIIKLCAGGGEGTVEDMCYEVRRAEACEDWFAHHALVNSRERDRCCSDIQSMSSQYFVMSSWQHSDRVP